MNAGAKLPPIPDWSLPSESEYIMLDIMAVGNSGIKIKRKSRPSATGPEPEELGTGWVGVDTGAKKCAPGSSGVRDASDRTGVAKIGAAFHERRVDDRDTWS